MSMMKNTIFFCLLLLAFSSCKKDKFTTAPQITFKSFKPNAYFSNSTADPINGPVMLLQLTDAEGDFGFTDGKDTSYIYVKNITVPPYKLDSMKFPDLSNATTKDLNVELSVRLSTVLAKTIRPNRPYTDSLRFEVYVKDFAKNKSNVLVTPEPFYYITP
ncbi:MAG: hypothetical protein JWQ27_723 [Ferruginibacter sp.]|nr:hypothetical protein [Ferruginibacter sp.]